MIDREDDIFEDDIIENNEKNLKENKNDSWFKYFFLALLFPVAGIVVYYMIKDEEPQVALYFKRGVITILIISILLFILYGNIIFLVGMSKLFS